MALAPFEFKNKHVVIFGLGRYLYGSGISAAKFFIREGAHVLIADKKYSGLADSIRVVRQYARQYNNQPTFVIGKQRKKDFTHTDLVMRNPGIPANNTFLNIARKAGVPIHTDVSLFLTLLATHYSLLTHIVGITGTRGKSTTAALLAHILKVSGGKVFLAGNMGYSPLNSMDTIIRAAKRKEVYVVLELSSWLTESLDDWYISPPHALITNMYPDHLNKYGSMSDYIAAKKILFKYQNKNDVLVLNYDNPITRGFAKDARARVLWFRKNDLKNCVFANLPGEHNAANIRAARIMAKALGVKEQSILQAVKRFKGLSGRLELIRSLRGIKFYNDTTATTPEATIAALQALPATSYQQRARRNIILIAGGADKKLDYTALAKEIPKHVKTLILFKGDASEKMLRELRIMNYESSTKLKIISSVKDMKTAVKRAGLFAQPGDVILLSPAAASFNMFKNEFDRGEQFTKLIKKIL